MIRIKYQMQKILFAPVNHLFDFCDHHQSSEGNLTLNKLKYDTGRFKCVCDRYKQTESNA